MADGRFLLYYEPGSGSFTVTEDRTQLERRIADILLIRTNTIAGRPNVGNLALEFTHKGRWVPSAVLRDYVLRTLRSFIPDVTFQVGVADGVDARGFQHVAVAYRVA